MLVIYSRVVKERLIWIFFQVVDRVGQARQPVCLGTTALPRTLGTRSAFQARVSDPTYTDYTLY